MKRFILLFGLIGLLLPSIAAAADGDDCALGNWLTSRGSIKPIWCILICDSKDAQDATCDEYDIQGVFPVIHIGIPDVLVFEINTSTGCTANATATLASTPTTAGTEHDLAATTAVSLTGNTKLSIDTSQVSIDRWVSADLTNMDNCTDFDVLMIGYERQRY